jgi:hypothetical protein
MLLSDDRHGGSLRSVLQGCLDLSTVGGVNPIPTPERADHQVVGVHRHARFACSASLLHEPLTCPAGAVRELAGKHKALVR